MADSVITGLCAGSMIFRPLPWRASQFRRRGSFLAFFSGAAFLQALNDLLQLLDPFPGARHFHVKLVPHALFQRADAHAKPVGLSGDSFVRDSEFLEVDPQIAENCPVRVAFSLQPLPRRLRRIPDASSRSLQAFITDVIEPGSSVVTEGWDGYAGLATLRYQHRAKVIRGNGKTASALLPRVQRVASLLERWLLGTHQDGVGHSTITDHPLLIEQTLLTPLGSHGCPPSARDMMPLYKPCANEERSDQPGTSLGPYPLWSESPAQWIECYRINGMYRIISSPCYQRKNGETFAKSSH